MIELTAILLLSVGAGDPNGRPSADTIKVSAVLVKLIEQVDVPAAEADVLSEVAVQEGQIIKAGQLLATIQDTESRLAEERAKTELDIARKQAKNDVNVRFAKKAVEVAKAELKRAAESNEKYPGSISDTEMDRLRLTVEKSILEVEQAEHELAIAQQTLRIKENDYALAKEKVRRRRITAPLNGVVVQVNRRQGEWVEPGDMVMRVLRIDRLRVEGFLKADDLKHELQDCPVTLRVELPGQIDARFPGKVVFIDPEIDPVNSQVRFWAEVENRGLKLRPGMRADMYIDVSRRPNDASK